MKKTPALLLTALLVLSTRAFAQERWERISQGILDRSFSLIQVSRTNPRLVLASTEKSLYRSLNGGRHWEKIFEAPGLGENDIQGLYLEEREGTLYLLATRGVYRTRDPRNGWDRLSGSLTEEGGQPLTLSSHPYDSEILYLGTPSGLYWSLDSGLQWIREQGPLGYEGISCIAVHPRKENLLFIATDEGLYRSTDSGRRFEKTFSLHPARSDPTEPEELQWRIWEIEISPADEQSVLLATNRGVWISRDEGSQWEAFPALGLESLDVRELEISRNDGTLFAATAKGIFSYNSKGKEWRKISQGIFGKGPMRISLANGETETLYAASPQGLFRWARSFPPVEISYDYPPLDPQSLTRLTEIFQKEPSVLEIQKAALRYADLKPSKVRRWQWASRLRTLLPELALSRDISIKPNIKVDQAGTKDPDVFITGPDEILRGEKISLTWDLADFLWNRDLTAIDARNQSRTQLRDQILSEATRLYFERRRLLLELYLNRPASSKGYLELLLRIDELTAQIDALTGGFLTHKLRRRGVSYS